MEFFGGEPLAYWGIVERVADNLLERIPTATFGVVTNGTLLNGPIIDYFEVHPFSVLLSLDGRKERHDAMRGGFDLMSKWFPRLAALGRVTVAMQAAIIPNLYDNLHYIWSLGFRKVFINMVENYDWYQPIDISRFEHEYERAIQGMLSGEGELLCALKTLQDLEGTIYSKGCGITRAGLACDWQGLLYPCHRAVELGRKFSIGSVYTGLDASLASNMRYSIGQEVFQSTSSHAFPMVSFCPVAVHQEHGHFNGNWNSTYCQMIEVKAKLVSKYYYELTAHTEKPEGAPLTNHK